MRKQPHIYTLNVRHAHMHQSECGGSPTSPNQNVGATSHHPTKKQMQPHIYLPNLEAASHPPTKMWKQPHINLTNVAAGSNIPTTGQQPLPNRGRTIISAIEKHVQLGRAYKFSQSFLFLGKQAKPKLTSYSFRSAQNCAWSPQGKEFVPKRPFFLHLSDVKGSSLKLPIW